MRLLFISPTSLNTPRGGRAMLARLHRDVLQAMLGSDLAEHRLNDAPESALRNLAGYIDGASPPNFPAILAKLRAHEADTVWLDGSNLGRIAQLIRIARPEVRIITFCHNVEARFFLGALRRARRPRPAGVLIANYVAERLAMRCSDTVIALSMRDSALLRRLYRRSADHLLPIALTDQAHDLDVEIQSSPTSAPVLFVGGAFYANRAGIAWFTRNVAPRITISTNVIGLGMEDLRTMLEATPGVRVIGPVDRLEPHYRAARIVIAPIFDGSGMKTKVAEGLMFGKHVIGTTEAFSGYANDVIAANALCNDADAFVAALQAPPPPIYDPAMRTLYERDHSPAATRMRLARILGVAT